MTASLGLPPLVSGVGALDMVAWVDSCSLSAPLRMTSRGRGLAPWAPESMLSSSGRAREGASGSDATLGWIWPGPGSPTDLRLVPDEDDVHRCGRCQAEFTALEDFVQHKLQKVCQRAPPEALPATPEAAALLDQEVSPPPTHMQGEEEVACGDRPVQLVPSDTGAGREQASEFVTLSQGRVKWVADTSVLGL